MLRIVSVGVNEFAIHRLNFIYILQEQETEGIHEK